MRAPNSAPWTGSCFVFPYRETTVQIDLTAGTTLRGRVLGSDGQPVSNADVEVGKLFGFPYDRRNTRDDGVFHIDGVAPGVIELRVYHATGAATYIVRGAPGEPTPRVRQEQGSGITPSPGVAIRRATLSRLRERGIGIKSLLRCLHL